MAMIFRHTRYFIAQPHRRVYDAGINKLRQKQVESNQTDRAAFSYKSCKLSAWHRTGMYGLVMKLYMPTQVMRTRRAKQAGQGATYWSNERMSHHTHVDITHHKAPATGKVSGHCRRKHVSSNSAVRVVFLRPQCRMQALTVHAVERCATLAQTAAGEQLTEQHWARTTAIIHGRPTQALAFSFHAL
jgi:hypothetical protein